ncbi:MAG TPA: GNAT family N-acetyltransferase [Solirubrobacteraceae bacterium]|nr:GNAT family N-acetyltransferase [Solirubrobacteraceae bacterium]
MSLGLRPASGRDADAIGALLDARDAVDFGRPHFTTLDLLDAWRPPDFDVERDAVVCETSPGGPLCGFAMVRRRGSFGAVSPAHERLGVGAALVAWVETRQRELQWGKHEIAVADGNRRAETLLGTRGYERAWANVRLSTRNDGRIPRAPRPAGVDFRTIALPVDAQSLYDIDAAAFGSSEGTLAEFEEQQLGAHDVAQDLSPVAAVDGRTVGFALVRRREQPHAAYIALLAVHPTDQRRGIGRRLVVSVMQAAQSARLEVEVSVADDNPGATRLYASLGLVRRFAVAVFEKPITRG